MRGLRSSRTVVIGMTGAVFVLCCVLPLIYMVGLSLAGGSVRSSQYAALVLDPRQRSLLYNTGILGAGTALLATLIGVPLGVALARVTFRWKTLLRVALAMPLLLPPYVVGLAWVFIGGSTGLAAQVIGQDLLSDWTYSTTGAVIVLTLVYYPVLMLATEVALRRIEPRLEEAALLVAPRHRVLWRITLPLATPSIIAAALVVFVLAISEFGVPGLLRVRVYTTEVFTAFAALYDFGRATVLAVPLLLLSGAIAAAAIVTGGERLIATRRGAASLQAVMFDAWKASATLIAACVVAVALLVPFAALTFEALGAHSWIAIFEGSSAAIVNSLLLSVVGATVTVAVGLWLGYARARARPWPGVAADVVFVVLFAVPSTVIGIGLIGLWNRPGLPGALYGTDAMLLLVSLARFLPIAALCLAATTRHIPISHEEAAAVAGARWGRTMVGIVLPQMATGVAAVWVIVFVLTFGELGASILVAPPGEATLPIRVYTLIANAPPADVAALALLQAGVIIAPLALLAWGVAAREAQ